MVATWAEKEMRNLLRIKQSGIRCPEPVILRGHVLVMEFLGKDGWYVFLNEKIFAFVRSFLNKFIFFFEGRHLC